MKTQDLHYVSMLKRMNEKKLDRLQAELPQSLQNQAAVTEHIIFAEDEQERAAILSELPAEISDDTSDDTSDADESSSTKLVVAKRAGSAAKHEYTVRKQRVETLRLAERKLTTQKHIMQPGRRKVVGQDEYEQPIFKWRSQRKK